MNRDTGALNPVSGKRLALTLMAGAAAAAAMGGVSWWAQTSLLGVSPILKQQVVTLQVYGVLVGALLFGFRPAKSPPLAVRGAPLRFFVLAPLVLAGVFAASAAIYFAASPITGGLASAARQILAFATDAKRLEGAPLHPWVVAVFRGVVVAPLFEELLFRSALLAWLTKHMAIGWAALCSTMFFTLEHGLPIVMPYAFLFGLGATWLRVRSESLLPGLVMHTLNSVVLLSAGSFLLR